MGNVLDPKSSYRHMRLRLNNYQLLPDDERRHLFEALLALEKEFDVTITWNIKEKPDSLWTRIMGVKN